MAATSVPAYARVLQQFREATRCAEGEEVLCAQLIEERRSDEKLVALRDRLLQWLRADPHRYMTTNASGITLAPLVVTQGSADEQLHRALRALVWLVQIADWERSCPTLDWVPIRSAYVADTLDIPTSPPHTVATLPQLLRVGDEQCVLLLDAALAYWQKQLAHEMVVRLPHAAATAWPLHREYRSPWPLWPTLPVVGNTTLLDTVTLELLAAHLRTILALTTNVQRAHDLQQIASYFELLRSLAVANTNATRVRAERLQMIFDRERTTLESNRAADANEGQTRFVRLVLATSVRANDVLAALQRNRWVYVPGKSWQVPPPTPAAIVADEADSQLQFFAWASGGCGNSCYVDAWLASALVAMDRMQPPHNASDPLLDAYQTWKLDRLPAQYDLELLRCFLGTAGGSLVDAWQQRPATQAGLDVWRWLIDVKGQPDQRRDFALHQAKVQLWRWASAQAADDAADPAVYAPRSCKFGSVGDLHTIVDRHDMQTLRTLPTWGLLSNRSAASRKTPDGTTHFTSVVDLRFLYEGGWALRDTPQPLVLGPALLDEWLRDRRTGAALTAAARVPFTIALVSKPSPVQVYYPARFMYDWNTDRSESYALLALVLYERNHYTMRFQGTSGVWYEYDSMKYGGRVVRAALQIPVSLSDMPLVELAWYVRDAPPTAERVDAQPRFARRLQTAPAPLPSGGAAAVISLDDDE